MRTAIPPLPNTPSWRGAQLKKHRGNFTFTFYQVNITRDKPKMSKSFNIVGLKMG